MADKQNSRLTKEDETPCEEKPKPVRKPRGVKKVDDIEEVVVSLAESLKIQPKKPRAKKQPAKAEEPPKEDSPSEKLIETPKTQPPQIIEATTTAPANEGLGSRGAASLPVKPRPKKIFC
jgi:hypothetical protein